MRTINLILPDGSKQAAHFPEDWTDDQIREAAYKHYPQLKPQITGLSGITRDIKNSISNLPAAIGTSLSNLPGQVYESGKQVLTNPARAVANVGAGTLEGLTGLANIPSNVATYLGSKNIGRGSLENAISKTHLSDAWIRNAMGASQPGDELLQGLGSFAPFGGIGGTEKGLAGLAARTGANAAYGISQNQNPLTASLMGLAGEGATMALQKAMRPGRFLPSSPMSNEELKQAQALTAGTTTGLGDVIQNPFLKRQLENVLPDLPFSGANEAMQNTARTIKSRGENIMDRLQGGYEGDNIGQALQDALNQSLEETTAIKNTKFKALNDAAEEEGVTTPRSNFLSAAQGALDKINSDPHLKLFAEPKIKTLLQNIVDEGKGDFSLENTDYVRSEVGEAAHEAFSNGDTRLGNLYKSLKGAADKDIDDAIDKSGNKNLTSLRDEAMDYYRKNYAPFKAPDIMKYTVKGGDPDTLVSSFLKTSQISDRSNLLSKLLTKLSPEQRQLLSYSYFSRAIKDGEFNPQSFKTLYKALGKNQKQVLLPEATNKEFADYSNLVQKNTEPLNLMFNPKTGQRLSSMAPLLSTLGTGIGALATGSLPMGLLAGTVPTLLARPAVKALTSEALRNRIVDSIIKARQKASMPSKNISPLVNALMQASNARPPMEINVNKFAGYGEQ